MTLPSWPTARVGVTWREVWLTLFGVYFGMAVGLHSAAGSAPPDPLWVSVLAGAALFTALFAVSWLGVMAVLIPVSRRAGWLA